MFAYFKEKILTIYTSKSNLFYSVGVLAILFSIMVLYYKSFLFVKYDAEISFIDNDTIYQIEHLASLSSQNHKTYVDTDVDYGIEIIYLSYIVKMILPLVSGMTVNVFCYYFLYVFHFLFILLLCLLIFKIFSKFEVGTLNTILFFLVIFSSVLFFSYSIFIKPDANVVLFFTLLAAYTFSLGKSINHKQRILQSVFFIAIGSLTKWWSAFLLPMVLFESKNFSISNRKIVKKILYALNSIAIIYFILLAMSRLDPVLYSQIMLGKGKWAYPLAFLGLLYLFFYVTEIIAKRVYAGKGMYDILTLFLFYIMLAGSAFFASVTFLNSFVYYTAYLGPKDAGKVDSLGVPFLTNAREWIYDSIVSGYISPILLISIILAIVYQRQKSKPMDQFVRLLVGYLIIINLFLFLFVTKKNHATQAMLLPLIWIVLFIIFNSRNHEKLNRFQIVFYVLVFLQLLTNFVPSIMPYTSTTGTIGSFFRNRVDYPTNLNRFNQEIDKRYAKDQILYLCDYAIPLDKARSFWVDRYTFRDAEALSKIVPSGSILFSIKDEVCDTTLKTKNSFKYLDEFSITGPGRTGIPIVSTVMIYTRN